MKVGKMRRSRRQSRCWGETGWHLTLLAIMAVIAGTVVAEPLRLVSTLDATQGPPVGGNGDSIAPVLSSDGRFVLFASTANNLVLTTNNRPLPGSFPASLNVYLRDRTNGTTTLVSVNAPGTGGGNGNSLAAGISADGRYALFESLASNLVPGDTNNASDIFLRDMVAGTTVLVSAAANGAAANGDSGSSVMTPDGRYVAFVSSATNIVAGDTNGISDVFVRDVSAGATTLVSVGAKAAALPVNSGLQVRGCETPDITPDGRYVAFFSTATNLVSGVVSVGDIYVRDLIAGNTVWASAGARAAVQAVTGASAAVCVTPALSTNGQLVAYAARPIPFTTYLNSGVVLRYDAQSGLTDLVSSNAPPPPWNYEDARAVTLSPDGKRVAYVGYGSGLSSSSTCIKVWDADSGQTILASGDLSNSVPVDSTCDWPTFDASGQLVAFLSSGTNLVTNSLAGEYHLYVRDLEAGATTLVATDTDGVGVDISPATAPVLSADGRLVAFECADSGLVPQDRNRDIDVFVRDMLAATTELVSVRQSALFSSSPNGSSRLSTLSVSTNGRYAAFVSEADNLVAGDTNRCRDIFVRDLLWGTNVLVSVGTNGVPADGPSSDPAISGSGRFVAFSSFADNLVAGDTNKASDVFVRDLETGVTMLVSANVSGSGPGSGLSYSPAISSDGRYVFYRSQALNLAAGSFSAGYENLVVRDMTLGTNYVLTRTSSGTPVGSMSAGGRFVASFGQRSNYSTAMWLWDCQAASVTYSNTLSGISNIVAAPDGSRIVYVTTTGSSLYVVELPSVSPSLIASGVSASRPGMRFSGDGQLLTYVAQSLSPATNRVYVHDFQEGTNILVSQGYAAGALADNASDSPDISADGRFIAYRSAAANLVPGDTNAVPDVFVYDLLHGTTTLLSASRFGTAAAENRSSTPVFSGDGQTLFFVTWASDVTSEDFNHQSDILAYNLYSSGEIPLFSAAIVPSAGSQRPWIIWPVTPGRNYRVEFKNSLDEAGWQELNGGVTVLGRQAFLNDTTAGPGPRFYRVVAE